MIPMVIPTAIGALLLLIGLVLFVVDLSVTNHGLPTAGGIVTLLTGGRLALTGKEGMIGEVGTVRSLVGVHSEGWIFVHGERWRALLAFAPEETDPREDEPVIGVGRKVTVVGFGEEGTVQVIPVERDYHNRSLDLKG